METPALTAEGDEDENNLHVETPGDDEDERWLELAKEVSDGGEDEGMEEGWEWFSDLNFGPVSSDEVDECEAFLCYYERAGAEQELVLAAAAEEGKEGAGPSPCAGGCGLGEPVCGISPILTACSEAV